MVSKKKIAIIGSRMMAKIIADRARELDIETHCFSWDCSEIVYNAVDFFYKVSIFDVDTIVDICKKNGVEGVIATTELTILPTAIIAEKLGLVGNSIKASEEITNKYIVRTKVKKVSKLNQPWFVLYKEGKIPDVKKFPVIVKPVASGGKRGICVINSKKELSSSIEGALEFSKEQGVLIEEYLVGGVEYSVESLSYKGKHYVIQVTQKDSSGPPYCHELGHHQPAELTKQQRNTVESVISDLLDEVGITNGPCHTEIKIIDNDIYLIEVNGRPGGDHITYPLTELSTEYPYVSGIIWIALNQFSGHEPVELKNRYCGVYFVTEETAYLQSIFDKCENFSWLYKKNQVEKGVSKIIYNDEDNLNYFIYYDKKEKPKIN